MSEIPKWCKAAATEIAEGNGIRDSARVNEMGIVIMRHAPNLGETVAASFELAQHNYTKEEHQQRLIEALNKYYR
jgi:hypothetical protein